MNSLKEVKGKRRDLEKEEKALSIDFRRVNDDGQIESTISSIMSTQRVQVNSTQSIQNFKRGDAVDVTIFRFGKLGGSVLINDGIARGLILQKEIDIFRKRRGGEDVVLGEKLVGYIERIRNASDNVLDRQKNDEMKGNEYRVDISLRPLDLNRILDNAKWILTTLDMAYDMRLPIGDKSSPEEISKFFYRMSRSEFKDALGRLYREGKIQITESEIIRQTTPTTESVQKFHNLKARSPPTVAKNSHLILLSNLPLNVTVSDITQLLKNKQGDKPQLIDTTASIDGDAQLFDESSISGIRITRKINHSFAHVDLINISKEQCLHIVSILHNFSWQKRKIRVIYKVEKEKKGNSI
jgi:hypothetical protein